MQALSRVLKGETSFNTPEWRIERSLPHGHVAAVLGMARKLGLHRLLPARLARLAQLALAMVVARVIEPAAKLATARQLSETTASHSLGAVLDLGEVDEDELYAALDLLGQAQPTIEAALARRHLQNGCLVLYDLISSYLEGRCCELARFGYSRDGQPGKPQIVFGLLCAANGCPVAVEVFEGNTADPAMLSAQPAKLRQRFGLERVVLVGDRGIITQARIEAELKPAGLDWIAALRAPAIQALAGDGGPLQLSLFDTREMAEITAPDSPGKRLLVCRNPALAEERARKRLDLLDATEAALRRVQQAVQRPHSPLRGRDAIGLRVGAVLGRRKLAKHFRLPSTTPHCTSSATPRRSPARRRWTASTCCAAACPLPTSTAPPPCWLTRAWPGSSGRSARSRRRILRCARSITVSPTGCAPVFLCILAYYVTWHALRARAATCAASFANCARAIRRPCDAMRLWPSLRPRPGRVDRRGSCCCCRGAAVMVVEQPRRQGLAHGRRRSCQRRRALAALEKFYQSVTRQSGKDCLDQMIADLDFKAIEECLGGFLAGLRNESAVQGSIARRSGPRH